MEVAGAIGAAPQCCGYRARGTRAFENGCSADPRFAEHAGIRELRSPAIEVLAASIAAVRTAVSAGADRIELCDNYAEGGTTSSAGTIAAALEIAGPAGVPVMVLIRPRGGGFVYDCDEHATMLRDAQTAIRLGAAGIVVGVLTRVARSTSPSYAAW